MSPPILTILGIALLIALGLVGRSLIGGKQRRPARPGVTLNELMITLDPYLRAGQGSRRLKISITESGPFITLYDMSGEKAVIFEDPEDNADRAARVDEVATTHTGRRIEPDADDGLHYAFAEPDGLRRFLDELLWSDYERTTIHSLQES